VPRGLGSLRARREKLGLTALELAAEAACPVEVLLRAEFGLAVPRAAERRRLAKAYRLPLDAYLRLVFDEAERAAG
jgi:transcriptional regulator with XRE-family HTH domain